VPGSDGYHQIEIMPFSEAQIHAAIKDVCLTIDMAQHYDIGEFIDHTIFVDLPPKAAKAYKEMEKKLYTELTSGEKIEAFTAAAKSQKLCQFASGAAYLGEAADYPGDRPFEVVHDEKMLALESVVEEAAGMPVLVAYQHKSDLARLLKWFPKGRHFDKADKTKADFIAGKIPLLFIHPMSGGHGVDGLQNATNIIVFFSQDWNLETYQQVSERIGPTRQFQSGYKRPAFRYHICARKTVDEVVMERRKSKSTVQDALLEYLKRNC
jgi:SNF2 family DNA or RNA helicase